MEFHFLKIDKYKLTSQKNVSEAVASHYPLSKNIDSVNVLTPAILSRPDIYM